MNRPHLCPLFLQRQLQTLTNEELEKLKFLEGFSYSQELESGVLWVRVMRAEEMDMTIALLAHHQPKFQFFNSSFSHKGKKTFINGY